MSLTVVYLEYKTQILGLAYLSMVFAICLTIYMCIYECMYVPVWVSMYYTHGGTQRGQKLPGSLELVLQMVVPCWRWVLGTKPKTSMKEVSALIHWAVSLVPDFLF